MKYRRNGKVTALVPDIGEDIVADILEICRREDIRYAKVEGIGAVNKATVGIYSLKEKKFIPKTYNEPLEMVSLLGNITRKGTEPYIHLHASFANENTEIVGGHLSEAVISVTAEIFITELEGEMGRKINPATGLYIFDI